MKKKATDIVTPFDWQRFTAAPLESTTKRARTPRPRKAMSVSERIARILSQRWGNPYCKPGAA